MNSSFNEGGQFAWDATSLELYQACPRKYYYTMVRNLEPRRKSIHLLFGGLYATALEHFYKYRALGDDLHTALRRVIAETLEAAADEEFNDNAKNLTSLLRSIVWYVDAYGEEDEDGLQTYHKSDGTPAVEFSFKFELTPDIVYCGHIDRVVTMGEDKFVLDNKTTSSSWGLSPRFFEQFKPSNQMMGYTVGGKIVLDVPVRGVIIDGAQIQVGATLFARAPVTYTKEQLDEWMDSAIHTVTLARISYAEDAWPMNMASCGNYGGCPFRGICSRPASLRENFLKAEFKERKVPWSPVEER